MKMKKIKTLSFVAILVSLFACNDDYLDVVPDDRAIINNESDVNDLLISAYPAASYFVFANTMSDEAGDAGKSYPIPDEIYREFYSYKVTDKSYQDTPFYYWLDAYNCISHANHAIMEMEKLSKDPKTDPKYSKLYGEALLVRAYNHFMLVNLWGKHYTKETAEKDLGVPYVTEPEMVVNPNLKRNTVAECYDKILTDMTEGAELLGEANNGSKYRFNKESVLVFAMRYFTYTQDWDKVIELGEGLFGSNPSGYFYNPKELSNEELAFEHNRPEHKKNILIASVQTFHARYYTFCRFGVTSATRDAVAPGVPNIFGTKGDIGSKESKIVLAAANSNIVYHPKFFENFVPSSVGGSSGRPYNELVILNGEEAFFNWMEAFIMTNDYDSFKHYMSYYGRVKCFDYSEEYHQVTDKKVEHYSMVSDKLRPNYPLNAKQAMYLQGMLCWKANDLLSEGMRWFDNRRFNMPVEHEIDDEDYIVLQKNDLRFQLQIPADAINDGLTPNER
jgi:hypothetical protein